MMKLTAPITLLVVADVSLIEIVFNSIKHSDIAFNEGSSVAAAALPD